MTQFSKHKTKSAIKTLKAKAFPLFLTLCLSSVVPAAASESIPSETEIPIASQQDETGTIDIEIKTEEAGDYISEDISSITDSIENEQIEESSPSSDEESNSSKNTDNFIGDINPETESSENSLSGTITETIIIFELHDGEDIDDIIRNENFLPAQNESSEGSLYESSVGTNNYPVALYNKLYYMACSVSEGDSIDASVAATPLEIELSKNTFSLNDRDL